jgi:ketosteroid isomerase-like protein
MTDVGDRVRRWQESFAAAQAEFVRGDAGPLKELISHGDDVTLLGAFGGYTRGWDEVGPRMDWAASQFHEGTWSSEDISVHATDDLVCLVSVERTEAVMGQGAERSVEELRVTHVLRREGDDLRIVHRHADPLRPMRAP